MTEIDNNRKEPEKTERITSYIQYLENKVKNIEIEIRLFKDEISKLENDVNHLKSENERYCEPPLLVGHIIDTLDTENNRAIVDCANNASYIVRISIKLQNEKIIPGIRVALNQRNYTIMEVLPSPIDPFVRGMEIIEAPVDASYDKIGGLEEQIQEVREIVELPLMKPEIFEKIGIEPPKGALFYGPPGTGKTLLAKAVAHETNTTFIRVIASELVQKFIGEGAQYVREIFKLAKEKSPTILFIDELDAIGAVRMDDATSGDREVNRTLMQLLSELDGFDQRGNIKFIAATNRADILDPALLRAGRFDRLVEFPLPDEKSREAIFKIHMIRLNFEENININYLVNKTEGATGSDIKAICTEAGMYAIRRDSEKISNEDFMNGLEKVLSKQNENYLTSNFFI